MIDKLIPKINEAHIKKLTILLISPTFFLNYLSLQRSMHMVSYHHHLQLKMC